MLFLLIQTGDQTYAIDIHDVIEVLPVVNWRKLPHSAEGILGIINYHGKPVPVVDLTEVIEGRTSRQTMSTRIVVVNYADSEASRPLALLTERILETMRIEDLRNVATTEKGIIQRINIAEMLPSPVRDQLLRQ
jgi:chemotaxis-related protein WspB